MSYILVLLSNIVLIVRRLSKKTEPCSYTKIKNSGCVRPRVSDLFLNDSQTAGYTPLN